MKEYPNRLSERTENQDWLSLILMDLQVILGEVEEKNKYGNR
tara:strand:- start:3105 stop:3230 length:126 start_codon:yes stop_codon:yes gene_type:complete